MLVNVIFVRDVNALVMSETIMSTLHSMYSNTSDYHHLHLLLMDEAAYMILTVKFLKKHELLFPHLHHVTCLAHAINVVCQEIMQLLPETNSIITEMKKVLIKAQSRKKAWLPLRPVPVVT